MGKKNTIARSEETFPTHQEVVVETVDSLDVAALLAHVVMI